MSAEKEVASFPSHRMDQDMRQDKMKQTTYDTNSNSAAETDAALIAMSGGVDSSVAALRMLDLGYKCVGCTMRLYENDMIGQDLLATCCSQKDTEDARSVCERLGIPYHIFHYERQFQEKVIEPFVQAYERCETPNPCIDCNRCMKFDSLFEKAEALGCRKIVTGHYARIEERDGHTWLKKAADPRKDQSYVLYQLTEEQLSRIAFPLGEITKEEVRKIAEEQGFRNAEKKESQDICFVPDGDYAGMICRYRNREYPEGDIVDRDGNVLGRHRGLIHYTIGQRRGLGVPADRRLYVTRLDPETNRVVLSDETDLFHKEVHVRDFHWITGPVPEGEVRCGARIRYRQKEQPATLIPGPEGGTATLIFDAPQRAATPGQSAVFYDGDYVLGGGIITN